MTRKNTCPGTGPRSAVAREQQRLEDARRELDGITAKIRDVDSEAPEFELLVISRDIARAKVEALQVRVAAREQDATEAEELAASAERQRLRTEVRAIDEEIRRMEDALTADTIAFDAHAAAKAREIDGLVARANELEGRAGDLSHANARRRTFWPAAADEPLRVGSSHPQVVAAAHARRTTRS